MHASECLLSMLLSSVFQLKWRGVGEGCGRFTVHNLSAVLHIFGLM